jgi:peptidoglycan/LPS O-acetylase OafA/YrhL
MAHLGQLLLTLGGTIGNCLRLEPASTSAQSATQRTSSKRNNAFGVVRLMLASWVILSHSPELIDGDRHRELLTRAFGAISFGELAVDCFFVLSGFLLTQSWALSSSLSRYMIRRTLRIIPGYVVAAVFSVFVVGALGAKQPHVYLSAVNIPRFIVKAITLGQLRTPATFLGQSNPSINASLWTIRHEFLCYLAIPALGTLGILQKRSAMLWVALASAGLFASSNFLLVHVGILPNSSAGIVLGAFVRLWTFFCWGAFAATAQIQRHLRASWFVGLLAFAGLALFSLGNKGEALLAFPLAYGVLYVGFRGLDFAKTWVQKNDISYGVYLYAWPIQKLCTWWIPGIGPWWLCALTLVLTSLVGALSWKLIEEPAVRLSERLTRRSGSLP